MSAFFVVFPVTYRFLFRMRRRRHRQPLPQKRYSYMVTNSDRPVAAGVNYRIFNNDIVCYVCYFNIVVLCRPLANVNIYISVVDVRLITAAPFSRASIERQALRATTAPVNTSVRYRCPLQIVPDYQRSLALLLSQPVLYIYNIYTYDIVAS